MSASIWILDRFKAHRGPQTHSSRRLALEMLNRPMPRRESITTIDKISSSIWLTSQLQAKHYLAATLATMRQTLSWNNHLEAKDLPLTITQSLLAVLALLVTSEELSILDQTPRCRRRLSQNSQMQQFREPSAVEVDWTTASSNQRSTTMIRSRWLTTTASAQTMCLPQNFIAHLADNKMVQSLMWQHVMRPLRDPQVNKSDSITKRSRQHWTSIMTML